MREVLGKAIKETIKTLGLDAEVILETPSDISNGDYSSPVALSVAKKLGRKPLEVAEEIKNNLGEISGIEKVEVAGPGFLNFFLTKDFLTENVRNILKNENFGENELYSGKKIMVEYTDPNPFKLFHIGHLMSNSIGESISRLFQNSGAKVIRANYQGDVGLHVAKTMWGMEKNEKQVSQILNTNTSDEEPSAMLGEWYTYGAMEYESNPKSKEEINKLNELIYKILSGVKISDNRETLIKNYYEVGRKVSLASFEKIYKKLGTKFDHYFFESQFADSAIRVVRENIPKVFKESDGAVVFPGEDYGLHTRVFITSKGLPTYEAKEIGLNIKKFEEEKGLDLSVVITANEQNEYFKVVLKAIELIAPRVAKNTKHFGHGMMRLPSGKMASRKGNVITGESLIVGVENLVKEKIKDRELSEDEKKEIVERVAIAGVKYSILKQSIGRDIHFDFEKSISFEGDSGPYIEYAYVRARAVLKKAKDEQIKIDKNDLPKEVSEVERLLIHFPEIIKRATVEFSPQHIASYLIDLSSAWNTFYAGNKIIGSEEESYRLMLADAVSKVLDKGMWLLGIKMVERM